MKDKNQRASRLGAGSCKVHRRTTWHNDIFAACAPNLLSLRRLQARFSAQRIPSFGARVNVRWGRHSWGEDSFHILGGVRFTWTYWKRADFSNAFAAAWSPAFVLDRKQPDFS